VKRESFSKRAWDVAKNFDYYPSLEEKKLFVSRVMLMYDDWRMQNEWAHPNEEQASKILSDVTQMVRTDPDAIFFTGDMPLAESFGTSTPGVQLPQEDQQDPKHRPGAKKLDLQSPPAVRPGTVRVKSVDKTGRVVYGQVKAEDVEQVLKDNPGWTRAP
jgi:hypothetical protein